MIDTTFFPKRVVGNYTPYSQNNWDTIKFIYAQVLKHGYSIRLVGRTSMPMINKLEYCFEIQGVAVFTAPPTHKVFLRVDIP